MPISPALLAEIQQTLSLIEHHESIITLLKSTVQAKLEAESGQKLSEGNWNLDLDAGELKHAE